MSEKNVLETLGGWIVKAIGIAFIVGLLLGGWSKSSNNSSSGGGCRNRSQIQTEIDEKEDRLRDLRRSSN